MLKVIESKLSCIDTQKFKEAFAAAQVFNKLLKEGKTEELVMAPVVENVKDKASDDVENKPHEENEDDDN